MAPPADLNEPSLRARNEDALDHEIERLEALLPPRMGKLLAYSQRPGSLHYRLPIAVLLVLGGCAGFLPILGFWMVPFGVMLIVQDVRPLRPLMSRAVAYANALLERHRDRGRRPGRPRVCVTERASVTCQPTTKPSTTRP